MTAQASLEKRIAIRVAGTAGLLLAVLLQPDAMGPLGRVLWTSAASVLFAATMVWFSSPARIHVLGSVFVVTAAMPLAVLFAIGQCLRFAASDRPESRIHPQAGFEPGRAPGSGDR